jgi:hypothetical protein
MITRKQFLAMSAALPAWCTLRPELAAAEADETTPSTAAKGPQETKVILSFATEVAEVPKDYDHIKALAEFLTAEGLVGNFHLTGDYARALKRHGRLDVVDALRKHEIGFHCNHHGAAPFMAGYLEKLNWRDGTTEWARNELPGLKIVEELFGRDPTYYTTEFNKAPQSVFASNQVGLSMIGYSTVPARGNGAVWYCNSFIPSCESAMGVERFFSAGLKPEAEGQYQEREKYYRIKFERFAKKLKEQKSTLIRAFQHSYKTYAVFPIEHPKPNIYREDDLHYEEHPHYLELLPEAKYRKGFDLFKRIIRYYAERGDFTSFSEYRQGFYDNQGHWLSLAELDEVCALLGERLDAYVSDRYSVSPAEAFGMLVQVLRAYHEDGALPEKVFMRNVIGPTSPIPEKPGQGNANSAAMLSSLRRIDRAIDNEQSIPSSIEIAGITVGPGQFLNGLRSLYVATRKKRSPQALPLSGQNLPVIASEPFFMEKTMTKDRYPEGFEGRRICQMCRLQSWSWKPAVDI